MWKRAKTRWHVSPEDLAVLKFAPSWRWLLIERGILNLAERYELMRFNELSFLTTFPWITFKACFICVGLERPEEKNFRCFDRTDQKGHRRPFIKHAGVARFSAGRLYHSINDFNWWFFDYALAHYCILKINLWLCHWGKETFYPSVSHWHRRSTWNKHRHSSQLKRCDYLITRLFRTANVNSA